MELRCSFVDFLRVKAVQIVSALVFFGFETSLNQRQHRDQDREEGDRAEAEERDQQVVCAAGEADAVSGHGRGGQNQHTQRGENCDKGRGCSAGNFHDRKSTATSGIAGAVL